MDLRSVVGWTVLPTARDGCVPATLRLPAARAANLVDGIVFYVLCLYPADEYLILQMW